MKITKDFELAPFNVPNYVRPIDDRFGGAFHIGDLDDQTLNQLCAQFREDVFAKVEAYRNALSEGN